MQRGRVCLPSRLSSRPRSPVEAQSLPSYIPRVVSPTVARSFGVPHFRGALLSHSNRSRSSGSTSGTFASTASNRSRLPRLARSSR